LPSLQVKPDSTNNSQGSPTTSLFAGHELPVKHATQSITRPGGYDILFFAVLFLAFSLFVIVKVYSPRKLKQMFNAFIKPAALSQLLREEYAFSNRSSVLLLILSLLVLPLFAYQAGGYLGANSVLYHFIHTRGILAYLLLMGFVFSIYFIKILTIKFLGFTLAIKGADGEYIYTILLFNKVAGLIMFPLVLLVAFARQLNTAYSLYTGLGILIILLIYRSLRLIQIGLSSSGVSVLYLFLYLCTLEIMPFVVLIKLFMFRFS